MIGRQVTLGPATQRGVRDALYATERGVEASHRALAAIIRGDVEPFLALYSDAEGITIGNPFGPFAVINAVHPAESVVSS